MRSLFWVGAAVIGVLAFASFVFGLQAAAVGWEAEAVAFFFAGIGLGVAAAGLAWLGWEDF